MELTNQESLSESECWDLLATASLGRLVLSLHALPAVLPVQYYVDGDELAVCLGHHQIPAASINDVIVAFEADAIDQRTRSGWAVQVQGTSRLPQPIGVPTDCGQPPAGRIAHLAPAHIQGQQIRLCPFILPNAGLLET
jgi:hypothetical protein